MKMSDKLKPCPFCGCNAKLVDHRTDWFAQCGACKVTVYGETVNHLDHIENDAEARAAFDAVDWDSLRQSAIDKWNARANDRMAEEIAALRKGLEIMIEQFESDHNCEYEYNIIRWNKDLLAKLNQEGGE